MHYMDKVNIIVSKFMLEGFKKILFQEKMKRVTPYILYYCYVLYFVV